MVLIFHGGYCSEKIYQMLAFTMQQVDLNVNVC